MASFFLQWHLSPPSLTQIWIFQRNIVSGLKRWFFFLEMGVETWRGLNPLNWHRQLFCFRHEYWLFFFVPKLFSVTSKNTPSRPKIWTFGNCSMMMSTKMKLHLRLKFWVRVITDEWVANGVGRNRQTPFLERSRPKFMRSYNWLLSSQRWCTSLQCANGDQCVVHKNCN